jgi:N-acetylneuraminate synthase/N,N'-diacetyllegionaminate synthase
MIRHLKINKHCIGAEQPSLIIAEAGVNHNGELDMAKKLCIEAKNAGADCIKFQTFKADRIVLKKTKKAEYQLENTDPTESQLQMLEKLELSESAFQEIFNVCGQQNIIFLSTPYDIEDVEFLDYLGVKAFKIASGQAVEPHFLAHVANKQKPILLSTGMSTMAEVREAVGIIRAERNNQIVVLQCTTNYPSSLRDCNLNAMVSMRQELDVLIGYSDHTQGSIAATTAVALGAHVIEKHFTLDRNLPGPDHRCSMNPQEFKNLVAKIRDVEICLGSARKMPTEREKANAMGMRRSLVSTRFIKAGTELSWNNLRLKRPGTGIPASRAETVLGNKAAVDILPDTIIASEMIQ